MKLSKDTHGKDESPHLKVTYVKLRDDSTTPEKVRAGEIRNYDAIVDTREEDEYVFCLVVYVNAIACARVCVCLRV